MTEYLQKTGFYRLDRNTLERIERYDCTSLAKDWVKGNCNTTDRTTDKGIMVCISRVANGKKNTAYGYKWEYDFDSLPDEEWKDVDKKYVNGIEGIKASNKGRMRNKNVIGFGSLNKRGYMVIGIRDKVYQIHRLVAYAWLPNPNDLPEVNHRNGNTTDNHIENLEWITHRNNGIHAVETGLHNCRKLVRQYDKNMNLIQEFDSVKEAAAKLDIHASNISHCCAGKLNSTGGYIWQFNM